MNDDQRASEDFQDAQSETRLQEEFRQGAGERITDSVELNKFLVTPQNYENSAYHQFVNKDMAVSRLTREDVMLVEMDMRLVNYFYHFGLQEIAAVYHAEMIGRITALRSVDGFERIQQSTQNLNFRKEITDKTGKGFLQR